VYSTPHIRRWAFRIGLLAMTSGVGWTQVNSCDLAPPYGTVDAADVQAIINMTINMNLGLSPCTANIAGSAVCNAAVVQRVVNAALGGACLTGFGAVAHYVSLSWTASTTPNVTYNVYRTTTSGVYGAPLASAGAATTYTDSAVAAGQTYYYVVTAVSSTGGESVQSGPAQATVPTP
jgi:hypothetical protein